MSWCPDCKTEYQEEERTCPVCGKKLQASPSAEPEMCILLTESDSMQLQMIAELLEREKIPSFILDRDSGDYRKVYMGFSLLGADLYVDKRQLEKAKNILRESVWSHTPLSEDDIKSIELAGDDEVSDDSIKDVWQDAKSRNRMLLYWFCIAIILFILAFLFGNFRTILS